MARTIRNGLKGAIVTAVMLAACILPAAPPVSAAAVAISQTGTIVTATNGDIALTYDLSDGKIFNFPTVSTSRIRLYVNKARFIPSVSEIEIYNVAGNTGYIMDQDNSGSAFHTYSDIRDVIERMQTFTLNESRLPRLDVYLYESYVNKLPEDNLYIDIAELDGSHHPVRTLFSAALHSNNVSSTPAPYSVYPRLAGLDTSKTHGFILRSPGTLEDGSTANKFGFAYSDDNPYAGGFQRLSTDGGATWMTESGGDRDLIFTIYK